MFITTVSSPNSFPVNRFDMFESSDFGQQPQHNSNYNHMTPLNLAAVANATATTTTTTTNGVTNITTGTAGSYSVDEQLGIESNSLYGGFGLANLDLFDKDQRKEVTPASIADTAAGDSHWNTPQIHHPSGSSSLYASSANVNLASYSTTRASTHDFENDSTTATNATDNTNNTTSIDYYGGTNDSNLEQEQQPHIGYNNNLSEGHPYSSASSLYSYGYGYMNYNINNNSNDKEDMTSFTYNTNNNVVEMAQRTAYSNIHGGVPSTDLNSPFAASGFESRLNHTYSNPFSFQNNFYPHTIPMTQSLYLDPIQNSFAASASNLSSANSATSTFDQLSYNSTHATQLHPSFPSSSISSSRPTPQPTSRDGNNKALASTAKKSKRIVSKPPTSSPPPQLENNTVGKTTAFSANSDPVKQRYRVIRGVSAGGSSTRAPREALNSTSLYLPTKLRLIGASIEDICFSPWTLSERADRRRIIRIERRQNGPHITANFSIVDTTDEKGSMSQPAPPNVDVVEVSCVECDVMLNDDYDTQSSDDEYNSSSNSINSINSNFVSGSKLPHHYTKTDPATGSNYQYFITSIEVVEIVELLIGTEYRDAAEKRRERGRVRSNLVPFWSKKSIGSKMHDSGALQDASIRSTTGSSASSSNATAAAAAATTSSSSSSSPFSGNHNVSMTNQDFRMELAKRIIGYRKPGGFDREVRILRWDKLVPALTRALQSYYTEIPQADAHLQFN
ncbi:uncharacterized protein LODBEIA_P29880 [Lodderomyces beijingensis]|uniref:TEA domain-containing protein n=1 Tax=Lodderomyces beijingensis TaxID=1775926 RepID=A0ABP0ZLK4_9ASCO